MDISELIRESRKKAGLSQENAAQTLPFDLRTLQAYECGERKVPADVIPSISMAYNDKQLLYKCLQECPAWKELFPKINFDHVDLRGAACRLPKKLSAVQRHIEDILDMASDNQLQAEELPEWGAYELDVINLLINLIELLAAAARYDTEKKK
jgi:transcriptional regulator with XRE-family HTH domain